MNSKFKTTEDVVYNSPKIIVFGDPDCGKTRLIPTAPNPLIISAESGLISIRGTGLKVWEIENFKEIQNEVLPYLKTQTEFETICFDTLTDICEKALVHHSKGESKDGNKKHGQAVYGEALTDLVDVLTQIRNLPSNVYMICRNQFRQYGQKGSGERWGPQSIGQQLPQSLPFFFSGCFFMQNFLNEETNQMQPYLLTKNVNNPQYMVRDRTGKLEEWEPANLQYIFNKLTQ